MMTAQMLNSTTPTENTVDAMRLLDMKAADSGEAPQGNAPAPLRGTINFVKSVTEGGKNDGKVKNPDEIELDLDSEEETEEIEEEEVPVE
ncbi:Similar to PPAF2: Phenoloxidase-activating factor 2 (Holotrichia diomphalia) [Cotesia congregata]|uniref:Similar to PPAF2: Phenoloxidase-activating factor 2 (Holotrichia diomphalia) n=1 Tax=Cotesia congregata TaxID=51543 RepID=A0A8J2EAJ1_COTCN|nr:Similar to PPAF2: Phenoloxidase-activating factor 2 (Holotrichia diomphalia) [Cotesia congregata]